MLQDAIPAEGPKLADGHPFPASSTTTSGRSLSSGCSPTLDAYRHEMAHIFGKVWESGRARE